MTKGGGAGQVPHLLTDLGGGGGCMAGVLM